MPNARLLTADVNRQAPDTPSVDTLGQNLDNLLAALRNTLSGTGRQLDEQVADSTRAVSMTLQQLVDALGLGSHPVPPPPPPSSPTQPVTPPPSTPSGPAPSTPLPSATPSVPTSGTSATSPPTSSAPSAPPTSARRTTPIGAPRLAPLLSRHDSPVLVVIVVLFVLAMLGLVASAGYRGKRTN